MPKPETIYKIFKSTFGLIAEIIEKIFDRKFGRKWNY